MKHPAWSHNFSNIWKYLQITAIHWSQQQLQATYRIWEFHLFLNSLKLVEKWKPQIASVLFSRTLSMTSEEASEAQDITNKAPLLPESSESRDQPGAPDPSPSRMLGACGAVSDAFRGKPRARVTVLQQLSSATLQEEWAQHPCSKFPAQALKKS